MTETIGLVRNQCGTEWGYTLHRLNGEPYCDACRTACTAGEWKRRRARGIPARQRARCGTASGYRRHLTTGTAPCERCRAAHAHEMRAYRHRKRRQAISTREWIRDILETWHGDWFTTKQLAVAVSEASGTAETTVRRAVNRLVNAAPNWLETQVLDGERRYRAQQRSYLWT